MSRSHRRQPLPSAFTLIEVMIVVAVLAVLSLAVLPGGGRISDDRARFAAELLVTDLGYAQIYSITNRADPCVVVFDTAAGAYHLARAASPTVPLTNLADARPYVTTFGSGRAASLKNVVITQLTGVTANRIAFASTGALNQTPAARISLRCGDAVRHVVVDPGTGVPVIE